MGRRKARFAIGGLTAGALLFTLALAHAPEMVRFAPLTRTAQAQNVSGALDAHEAGRSSVRELARELGVKAQPVKAVIADVKKPEPLPKGAVCRRAHHSEQNARLTNLTMPPSAEVTRKMVVMADWENASPAQMVIAVERAQTRPAVLVRYAYAVIRTPEGWLVIQI
jgi:hypothetical protein